MILDEPDDWEMSWEGEYKTLTKRMKYLASAFVGGGVATVAVGAILLYESFGWHSKWTDSLIMGYIVLLGICAFTGGWQLLRGLEVSEGIVTKAFSWIIAFWVLVMIFPLFILLLS